MAADLVEAVFGEGTVEAGRVPGPTLVGLRYERPFTDLAVSPEEEAAGWRVVAGAFVEADEGTGIVHLAPAFGEVDREVGRAEGLPTLNPVGPDGRFTSDIGWLAGRPVREANTEINDRLEAGRPARAPSRLPALVPALLAVRHPAHLLGQAELVRPHVGAEGPPGEREPDHRLAPRSHP